MKVVIANGFDSADYLIKLFKKEKHQVIVINKSQISAKYISEENGINVYIGDPTREFVLEKNNIYDANLFIALSKSDTDNYVACMLAKKIFRADKCICSVSNPKNVDLYKQLGIDVVISSTYLIGENIKNLLSVTNMVNSLTFENSQIIVSEIILNKQDFVVGKSLKDLSFSEKSSIGCIFRKPNMIIPKGSTILLENDKVFAISSHKEQKSVIDYIKYGKY